MNKGIKHSWILPYHPTSNEAAERSVQVANQAIRKMGNTLPLKVRLTEFLLINRTTPHAATERHPDEMFYIVNSEHVSHRFSQPGQYLQWNTISNARKQHMMERTHNQLWEKILLHNQRGWTKWLTGTIIRRKSPVAYLVRMAQNTVRYCHIDHLLHDAGLMLGDSDPQKSES